MKIQALTLLCLLASTQALRIMGDSDAAKQPKEAPAAAPKKEFKPDANQRAPVGELAKPVKAPEVPKNFQAEPAISDQVEGTIKSTEGSNVSTFNPNSPDSHGTSATGSNIEPYTATVADLKENDSQKGKEAAPAKAALIQLDEPCEPALDVSQKQLDIELDQFSRSFDRKRYNNARIIYDELLKQGKTPRVAIHTWELYDNAFSFPRVRRYELVQHHMDLLQHFEDNLNSNFTNGQHVSNFIEVARKAQDDLNAKYHNGEFADPANFDPEGDHPVTWSNVKL